MGNTSTDLSKLSAHQLAQMLKVKQAEEAAGRNAQAQVFADEVLPSVTFTTNEKGTWHGAAWEATAILTDDEGNDREVGVRVFFTDVAETKRLKEAAKKAAA